MPDEDRGQMTRRGMLLAASAGLAGCSVPTGSQTGSGGGPTTEVPMQSTDDGSEDAATRQAGDTAAWPQLGFDAGNTGYNPIATAPTGETTEQWSGALAGTSAP